MQDELTPEYINSLPAIKYMGVIELVEDKETLKQTFKKLMQEPCVGFDTESRPSFTKGKIYPISIIQIATPSKAYIIKIRDTGYTDELIDFMNAPLEKVGVGLADDIKKMRVDMKANGITKKLIPNGIVDLSTIASQKGYKKTSLRVLCARYLKQRLTKTLQKTNWARSELTEAQLRYAATDAWICLLLRPFVEKDDKLPYAEIEQS